MSELMEAKGLTKKYGWINAVDNHNFIVGRGRIVGLLGPNGSGKSTLLKLAAGLLVPTEGEILIEGNKPGVESKKVISYLPDKPYFDDWMKVGDCFKLFEDFYEDFDGAKAHDMINTLNIDPSQRFKTLSKGTKEKVQLVLTMSRKAHLYLLDEPIGGVDPAARDFILDTIISNYNEEGTVIISTHLIMDIERVLDDVIFLQNGRIERVSSVDAIRSSEGKSVDDVFREVFRC